MSDAELSPIIGRGRLWIGRILIGLGGLTAALCGGTALFLGMAIFLGNDMSEPGNVRWLLFYVLLGGVPALIGLGAVGVGMLVLQRRRR